MVNSIMSNKISVSVPKLTSVYHQQCQLDLVKWINSGYLIQLHTHPFNGPFSGTTRVSRYQKGKTNLDFTEARDSEWQWHQLGHMQVHLAPDR